MAITINLLEDKEVEKISKSICMRSIFFTILLAISFGFNGLLNAQNQEERDIQTIISEFKSKLKKGVEDDNVKGSISAAIVKGNQIIWSGAYGLSGTDNISKADSTTIYRTGSISKSFTAFLMMQLVQDSVIKLNDPIEKYLPEIKELIGYSNETIITFQQLASHTSGLIREPNLKNAASGPISDWESKILKSIPKTSFKSKPGTEFSYSNIGYGILGYALGRASDRSFIDLVKERIFQELNMNSSFLLYQKVGWIILPRA